MIIELGTELAHNSERQLSAGWKVHINHCINESTLLIGNAIGKQMQTRTRTIGAVAAPMASPYLEQRDCGMICSTT